MTNTVIFVDGGPQITCELLGAPDAPALIFAHGNSSHRGMWRPVARLLVDRLDVRAVLVDLRGHGDSEHVRPAAYNPADHARDLARIVRYLAPSRYAVLGHSAGALAVTSLAVRLTCNEEPGPTPSAVIWVDLDPCVPAWQVEYFNTRADNVSRSYPDADTATRSLVRGIQKTSPGVPEQALWDFVAEGLVETPDGWRLKLDPETYATWAPGDLRPQLPLVEAPALIVRGGASNVSSLPGFQELVRGFRRSRGEVVDGGTHLVPLDHPAELAALIGDFLRRDIDLA
jgi:pimeloyl-ACP methyl ester carboxylesterase